MAQPIENYLPGVRDNSGITTNEAATFNAALTLNSPATLTSTLAVTGASTLTGNVTFAGTNVGSDQSVVNVNATTGTVATLTSGQSTAFVVVTSTTGSFIHLPASTVGTNFEICYPSSSAGTHLIATAATASTFVQGSAYISQVSATTGSTFIGNGTTHTGLSMNCTTTGGSAGTYIFLTCVSATEWVVDGSLIGSGQLATPFAAL